MTRFFFRNLPIPTTDVTLFRWNSKMCLKFQAQKLWFLRQQRRPAFLEFLRKLLLILRHQTCLIFLLVVISVEICGDTRHTLIMNVLTFWKSCFLQFMTISMMSLQMKRRLLALLCQNQRPPGLPRKILLLLPHLPPLAKGHHSPLLPHLAKILQCLPLPGGRSGKRFGILHQHHKGSLALETDAGWRVLLNMDIPQNYPMDHLFFEENNSELTQIFPSYLRLMFNPMFYPGGSFLPAGRRYFCHIAIFKND